MQTDEILKQVQILRISFLEKGHRSEELQIFMSINMLQRLKAEAREYLYYEPSGKDYLCGIEVTPTLDQDMIAMGIKAPTPRLKPCPFCGSSAGVQKDITGEEQYHVVCNDKKSKCPMIAGIPVWSCTEEEAIEQWNRRAE